MSVKIKITANNKACLDGIFKNTPKSLEEALARGLVLPEPEIKYSEIRKVEGYIKKLFEKHIEENCSCKAGESCTYIKYHNKEITVKGILELSK